MCNTSWYICEGSDFNVEPIVGICRNDEHNILKNVLWIECECSGSQVFWLWNPIMFEKQAAFHTLLLSPSCVQTGTAYVSLNILILISSLMDPQFKKNSESKMALQIIKSSLESICDMIEMFDSLVPYCWRSDEIKSSQFPRDSTSLWSPFFLNHISFYFILH